MSPWQKLIESLISTEFRLCNKCGDTKPATKDFWYFQKQVKVRRGVTVYAPQGHCKECTKSAAKSNHWENRDRNLVRMRDTRAADPERFRAYEKSRREMYPEKIREWNKKAYEKDKERRKSYQRQLRIDNPDRIRKQDRDRRTANIEYHRKKERDRRASNVVVVREQERERRIPMRQFLAQQQREARKANPERYRQYDLNRRCFPRSVASALTRKIRQQLKSVGSNKEKRRRLITGWSIADLAAHLEPLFEAGMTFENWGEWQVDHIVPMSAVKFSSEDDQPFKDVWSLGNLAPLWAFDNNSKHNRTDWVMPETYCNEKLREMYRNPPAKHLLSGFTGFKIAGEDLC